MDITFNQAQFDSFANEVSIDAAVDVARASGVPAYRINNWLDDLTHAMMEDVSVIIEEGNRARAAG